MDIKISDFIQQGEFAWELPASFRNGMRTGILFFSDQEMLENSLCDRSVEQAANAAFLPGVVGPVCVMPDMHQGYGFPIGGVAATSMDDGVISPSAVGYDINCGVRLLASQIPADTVSALLKQLIELIFRLCPSGVGKSGRFNLSGPDIRDVCVKGVGWAARRGFLESGEENSIEDMGCMEVDSESDCSVRAFERGLKQLGSLGAGNHFIEIDCVDQIFDQQTASLFGLTRGNIAVQVHSGSRGFGHQICTDYVRIFNNRMSDLNQSFNRELVHAPINSKLGQAYFNAMKCAANYAFTNRQLLAFSVREAFNMVLEKHTEKTNLITVYDLAHNIGKVEQIDLSDGSRSLFVHRKGATRSLGPGNPILSAKYRSVGQPVLVPGSMGTSSWVMKGMETASRSMNSCCHGAGRVLSRSQARRNFQGHQVVAEMDRQGIIVQAGSMKGLAEEAPRVYKDVDRVINCVAGAGLASKVARLRPLAIIKG